MTLELAVTPRILVADDDPSIRRLVCTFLEREQVEVDCVADGAEAIDLLKQHSYSIIFLDLVMPIIDGFGVIAYLSRNPPAIKPIVLVMSSHAERRFREVDPDVVAGMLRKPFDVSELSNVVRLCLQDAAQIPERLFYSKERALQEYSTQGAAARSIR